MVYAFTKIAEFVPIDTKTPLTQVIYNEWICRFEVPAVITTDNGSEFASVILNLVSRLGIRYIHTSVNHPSANG